MNDDDVMNLFGRLLFLLTSPASVCLLCRDMGRKPDGFTWAIVISKPHQEQIWQIEKKKTYKGQVRFEPTAPTVVVLLWSSASFPREVNAIVANFTARFYEP